MSDILVTALTTQELYHHGIEGMHWGERRYQNYDGSLTEDGRKRYGIKETKKAIRTLEGNVAQSLYNKERAEKDLQKITGKGYLAKSRDQLSDANKEKYDKQIRMYTDILTDLSSNIDDYKAAVDDAKATYGNTKIKDIKRNKKTGQMQVRLPGQEKWTAAATVYALVGPGSLLTSVPISYAIATVGPKINASKEYKNLKKLYAEN